MKKSKKLKFSIFLIIFVILIGVSLFIGYAMPSPSFKRQKYNEEKTYEYSATYKSKKQDKDWSYVYVEEFKHGLMFDTLTIMNIEGFESLKEGEKITFRSVFKHDKPEIDSPFLIVSLKTEDAEIVTLESTISTITKAEITIAITATVFSIFFLIGGIVCFLYLFGVLPKKKN